MHRITRMALETAASAKRVLFGSLTKHCAGKVGGPAPGALRFAGTEQAAWAKGCPIA